VNEAFTKCDFQAAVDRVLENWNALRLFFQSEYLEDNLHSTKGILDSLENPVYKIYLSFLSYILGQVNKLNLEFQAEKPKLHLLLQRTNDLYRAILRNFVVRSHIESNSLNLNDINFRDSRNIIPLENIFFGVKVEMLINNHPEIPLAEITNFKKRALDFYIELCQQIRDRFDFDNAVLKFVSSIINPQEASSGNIPNIIQGLHQHFPNLIQNLNDKEIENLNSEWRLLPDVSQIKLLDTSDVEAWWSKVLRLKNDLDNEMFPNLKNIVFALLSLPHSSAAAERKFSDVSLIKNKLRNRLETETVNNILHCKEHLGENVCYLWEPSNTLLRRKVTYN